MGGLGQISAMLILWGQGKGRGRVGGQTLGMLILGGGGGLGQKRVCPYYGGGVFWNRHWGCKYSRP